MLWPEAPSPGKVRERVAAHQQSWKEQRTPEYRNLQDFQKWAMLGSNQRPLPCEVRSDGSQRFADVHKPAQISRFCGERTYVNLTVSACTGVQLVYSRPLHYFIHPSAWKECSRKSAQPRS